MDGSYPYLSKPLVRRNRLLEYIVQLWIVIKERPIRRDARMSTKLLRTSRVQKVDFAACFLLDVFQRLDHGLLVSVAIGIDEEEDDGDLPVYDLLDHLVAVFQVED
jgi:hypothetical protein